MDIAEFCVGILSLEQAAEAAVIAASAPDPWSEASIIAAIQSPARVCLAAYCGQRLAGFACFLVVEDTADCEMVAVHADLRRCGAGMALLTSAEPRLRALGAQRILLEVRVSNTSAQALYQKLGYRTLAIRPGMYQNPPEDGLLMAKVITV